MTRVKKNIRNTIRVRYGRVESSLSDNHSMKYCSMFRAELLSLLRLPHDWFTLYQFVPAKVHMEIRHKDMPTSIYHLKVTFVQLCDFNRLWWKFFCVLYIIACAHYHLMHFEWLSWEFDYYIWIWSCVSKCIMTALIHLYDRKHYLSTFYDILLQYVVTNLCIALNWPNTFINTAIGSGATIDAFDAKYARCKKLS
jgi:hypothetical protein